MARFPGPAESRLEGLLREAFEFMPGPDMARLAGIEITLLRAARRPAARANLPWWAILLVTGGAASAAWWAGERWLESRGTTGMERNVERTVEQGPEKHGAGKKNGGTPGSGSTVEAPERSPDKSPIIDRREEH